MFLQHAIEQFQQYWRRRRPGTSTAIHYGSDVRIFFHWALDRPPDDIGVHDVARFIEWQQALGHAPSTITRRLVALRMFHEFLSYARDAEVANPVVPHRHYLPCGRRLPRDVQQALLHKLFTAIGEHPRDRCL